MDGFFVAKLKKFKDGPRVDDGTVESKEDNDDDDDDDDHDDDDDSDHDDVEGDEYGDMLNCDTDTNEPIQSTKISKSGSKSNGKTAVVAPKRKRGDVEDDDTQFGALPPTNPSTPLPKKKVKVGRSINSIVKLKKGSAEDTNEDENDDDDGVEDGPIEAQDKQILKANTKLNQTPGKSTTATTTTIPPTKKSSTSYNTAAIIAIPTSKSGKVSTSDSSTPAVISSTPSVEVEAPKDNVIRIRPIPGKSRLKPLRKARYTTR